MSDETYLSYLLSHQPDSLALLLEEQINPSGLSDSSRAAYGWWITRLHQQQGRSLINDTIIHYTLRYYQEHQSPRLPLSYALAAKQINWSGDKEEEAKHLFLKGIEVAESRNDTVQLIDIASNLKTLGGDIHQSIAISKKIIAYTNNDLWTQMIHFYTTGCSYALLDEPDSTTYYMTEAIRQSQELKEKKEYYITRNYIDFLNASDQSKKALPMMRELEQKFSPYHLNDSIVNTFAYICIWLNLGKNDSVQACLDRLDQYSKQIGQTDFHREYETPLIYVTKLLRSAYEVKTGQPLNILDIYRFSEVVASTEKNKANIERERIFVQNKLKQDNLLLKIKEEQGRQFLLYILLIASCIIAILTYLYQRKLLKKERTLQQSKKQMQLHQIALNENKLIIRQNEETIQAITSQLRKHSGQTGGQEELLAELEQTHLENEQLQRENQSLQKEITKSMQILPDKKEEMEAYERMAEQSMTFNQCAKQLSAILIGQHDELRLLQQGEVKHLSDIDWSQIFRLMNKVFNKYTDRLQTSFPLLTEEDVQCCCLIKLQLSTSAIARLYGIAPSSVTKRKQRIKERINQAKKGLLGKDQPVDVYLWGY